MNSAPCARTERFFHLPRNWPTPKQWAFFFAQCILVVLLDTWNDIFRGNIDQANGPEALDHARQVVTFEAAHGFFLEPAIQLSFEKTQHFFFLVVTWASVVHFVDGVYEYCHIFVTLAVVAWIYVAYRHHFGRVRNLLLFTNLIAGITYEIYPLAPPRLTTGIIFDGRAFRFQDPMEHIIGTGKLNSVPIGYNPFSAMPSLHMAWAIIVGLTIIVLAKPLILKILGGMYPLLMLFTVVVTGNHYFMDAVGAALAVGLSALATFALERAWRWWRTQRPEVSAPAAVT